MILLLIYISNFYVTKNGRNKKNTLKNRNITCPHGAHFTCTYRIYNYFNIISLRGISCSSLCF